MGLVDGNDALTSEIQISLVTDVEGSDANGQYFTREGGREGGRE